MLSKIRKGLTAGSALCLALVAGAGNLFAQATAAPVFTDITDAVDINAPLTSFSTYAAGVVTAVVVIALAFLGVRMAVKYISGMGSR